MEIDINKEFKKIKGEISALFDEDIFSNCYKNIFGDRQQNKADTREPDTWSRSVDTEDGMTFEFDLPGFDKKDIKISRVNKDTLELRAEREATEKSFVLKSSKRVRRECSYDISGHKIDSARLENGMLTVKLVRTDDVVDIEIQ